MGSEKRSWSSSTSCASDRAIRLQQQHYRLSPSFKAVPAVWVALLVRCCFDAQPPRSGKLEERANMVQQKWVCFAP